MINTDFSKAKNKLSDTDFSEARNKALSSFEKIRQKSGAGAEWLGWRSMLADPNDAMLEELDSTAASIRQQADVFLVCGIGGSYLGARAIIDSLQPFFPIGSGPEIIFCGHQLSGRYLEELITYLEQPNEEGEPKSVYLNAISKSGTTLETALAFRTLRVWMEQHYEDDIRERIICTTSPDGGAFNRLIDEKKYRKFEIPEDVGGRFSVLTPVGLLPVAVAGIDIRSLFYQAVKKYNDLENNPDPAIDYAACRFALYKKGVSTDVITSFEPQLHSLGLWLQQLFGESEGKQGKGIFPAVSTFSTDLHSIGQFIQGGPRELMETFITVKKPISEFKVAGTSQDHDGLNYLAGKSFHEINQKAFKGTLSAHSEDGVPCITVSLDEVNAPHIGEFIYFFELITAIYCYCLDVNPFDQPGVEAYKKEMYKLLGKNA